MSDLFIGKPGGLTTAECLASGLPMVIVLAPSPARRIATAITSSKKASHQVQRIHHAAL